MPKLSIAVTHSLFFSLFRADPAVFFRTSCGSWAVARAECQAGGGDLVVITDATKNEQVKKFMQSFSDYGTCRGPYPWIGGHKCAGSTCTWVDGSPWNPAAGIEPNSYSEPGLHLYTSGKWGTHTLSSTAIGLCERQGEG